VVVSDSLVAHCASDGDLALVIGHELAHNFLHHSQWLAVGQRASRGLRLTGTGSAEMRETEEAADRLGVRLASAAAYDLSDALSFVTALLDADGAGLVAGTHPAPARRLALLRAEIAAADAKRSLSAALVATP
jgi:predicted Zn-dependent protease